MLDVCDFCRDKENTVKKWDPKEGVLHKNETSQLKNHSINNLSREKNFNRHLFVLKMPE